MSRLAKPNDAHVIDQNEGGKVMRHASAARFGVSLFMRCARSASVCQLKVMYTRCDNAMTNTIVPRFTVRIPILWPRSDWMSKVNKTALEHVHSIPTNSRIDRNRAAIVRPNNTTAVRVKYRKSCARLRRSISTTYGGPAM